MLADAIARAVEDEPDYLIEASTLTGAQLVALGTRVIGAMGERRLARPRSPRPATRSARRSGRCRCRRSCGPAWTPRSPTWPTSPADRLGGMLVGGAFLGEFVPDGLPWVHLDIAGPAFNKGSAAGLHAQGRDRRRRAHDHRAVERSRRLTATALVGGARPPAPTAGAGCGRRGCGSARRATAAQPQRIASGSSPHRASTSASSELPCRGRTGEDVEPGVDDQHHRRRPPRPARSPGAGAARRRPARRASSHIAQSKPSQATS